METKLMSTKDYSLFALYEDNRVISQRSIEKMVSTIAKKNLLAAFPLVVYKERSGKMFITDGQRRFLAAKQMGLTVHYIVCNACTKDDIPSINSGQQGWKNHDYLHSFCIKAKQNDSGRFADYLRLEEFVDTYSFNIASSICMTVGYSSTTTAKNFKEGKFEITDYHKACKTAENILDMKPYHDKWKGVHFIRAMTRLSLNPKYDHQIMMAKLRVKHEELLFWSTTNGYIMNMQKIYNHSRANKVIFVEE